MTELREPGDLIEVGALRPRCRIGCSDEEHRQDSDAVGGTITPADFTPAGVSR